MKNNGQDVHPEYRKSTRLVFDARGNGEGTISPTITGDHQNRITDYTAIVVEYEDDNTDGKEIF